MLRALLVIPALAALLRPRVPPWIRANAALALGHLGHPDALPVLRIAVRPDEDHAVRRTAAISLGRWEDEEGAAAVLTLLGRRNSEHHRASAALCLGHLLSTEDARPLVTALKDPANPRSVRNLAAVALGILLEREHPHRRLGDHMNPYFGSVVLAEISALY